MSSVKIGEMPVEDGLPSTAPTPSMLSIYALSRLFAAAPRIVYEEESTMLRSLLIIKKKAILSFRSVKSKIGGLFATKGKGKFSLFDKLPQEIKDRIWKLYIKSGPRIVNVNPPELYGVRFHGLNYIPTPSVTIRQINRALREDAFTVYGYVELEMIEQTRRAPSCKFVFHPELDMVYVATRHLCLLSPFNIMERFQDYHVLENIRCLALDIWVARCLIKTGLLSDMKRLELLFLVLDARFKRWEEIPKFQFVMNYSDLMYDRDLDKHELAANIQTGWKEVQGNDRRAPLIEFVQEL